MADPDPDLDDRQPLSPERRRQVWAHLSALCCLIGVPSILGPLLVYALFHEDEQVAPHARAAVEFHATMLVAMTFGVAIAFLLVLVTGWSSIVEIWLLVCMVVVALIAIAAATGALRAYRGELWRYPLAVHFLSE